MTLKDVHFFLTFLLHLEDHNSPALDNRGLLDLKHDDIWCEDIPFAKDVFTCICEGSSVILNDHDLVMRLWTHAEIALNTDNPSKRCPVIKFTSVDGALTRSKTVSSLTQAVHPFICTMKVLHEESLEVQQFNIALTGKNISLGCQPFTKLARTLNTRQMNFCIVSAMID